MCSASKEGEKKSDQTSKAKTESLRLSHIPFIMAGTRVKAAGCECDPRDSQNCRCCEETHGRNTNTGCLCTAGWGGRIWAYLQTQFLVSPPALISYVRDADDDQISSDINF